MSETQHCLHIGEHITESECFRIVSGLQSAELAKCQQDCARGRALISTTPGPVSKAAPSPAELAARQPMIPFRNKDEIPRNYLLRIGEVNTGKALAAKLGVPQTSVSILFNLVDAGDWPKNERSQGILRMLRVTREHLFPEASAQVEAMIKEHLASTPATPPAPDQQRADEELAQRLETAAAPIVDATGASIHVPAGDLAADLANPANILHMPGQAPPVQVQAMAEANAAVPSAFVTVAEAAAPIILARALAAPAAQGDAADDFVPYTGIMPAPKSELVIILDVRGRIGITAATVREFGLADCTHMELFWSASRRQIGLRPATDLSPHKLAVARGRKGKLAQIHGSGFYKAFGLKPVYGRYPLHRAPSGMLVATIELESEEAKAS